MNAYYDVIAGKSEKAKDEDAAYIGSVIDWNDQELGLYMISDGCSGYVGAESSHLALSSIRRYMERELRVGKERSYETVIREAIAGVNQHLWRKSGWHATLDLALISDKEIYTAHLGDGQICFVYNDMYEIKTPDQSAQGKPSNYLGEEVLDGRTIDERIYFRQYDLEKELETGLRYVDLHTDGLRGRATKEDMHEILLHTKLLPHQILAKLREVVICPKRKIREVEGLERRLLSKIPWKEQQLPEETDRDTIIRLYKHHTLPELVRKIDNGLEGGDLQSDDTAIVLIDFEDKLEAALSKYCRWTEDNLEEELERYQKMVTEDERWMKAAESVLRENKIKIEGYESHQQDTQHQLMRAALKAASVKVRKTEEGEDGFVNVGERELPAAGADNRAAGLFERLRNTVDKIGVRSPFYRKENDQE